mmetsp:Transcript_15132/g.41385  ORF Transcript_15132/g.41385 Transcript_15132/m.41385 type:complete len:223 (-) Transcript_15132:174-842(-)
MTGTSSAWGAASCSARTSASYDVGTISSGVRLPVSVHIWDWEASFSSVSTMIRSTWPAPPGTSRSKSSAAPKIKVDGLPPCAMFNKEMLLWGKSLESPACTRAGQAHALIVIPSCWQPSPFVTDPPSTTIFTPSPDCNFQKSIWKRVSSWPLKGKCAKSSAERGATEARGMASGLFTTAHALGRVRRRGAFAGSVAQSMGMSMTGSSSVTPPFGVAPDTSAS